MSEQLTKEDSDFSQEDLESLKIFQDSTLKIRNELAKVIVGQEKVIDQLLVAIFSKGHCLLEGVPGLAKTLMVSTLAKSLRMDFNRIQFTPDLMPSDITGTDGLRTTTKSERHAFKADYVLWRTAWRTNFLAGNSDGFADDTNASGAYDGTFTSVDGSTAVNVDYADE